MLRASFCLALLALIARSAFAGDIAAAEALFREGKRLLEAGKIDQACPKFAASLEAEPSVGAMLNLAQCHAEQGKTATAWGEYHKAAVMAQRVGQEERAAGARDLAAELEPRLSRLSIEVRKGEVAGLTVTRNGERVPEASFGVAVPVDPGRYTIEATAPGHELWKSEIEIGAEADLQTIAIPALVPAPEPEAAEAARGDGSVGATALAGAVLAGVGVAALASGIGLGVKALDDTEALDARCPVRDRCPNGAAEAGAIRPIADGATAAIVIGAVALVTGTTLRF